MLKGSEPSRAAVKGSLPIDMAVLALNADLDIPVVLPFLETNEAIDLSSVPTGVLSPLADWFPLLLPSYNPLIKSTSDLQ